MNNQEFPSGAGIEVPSVPSNGVGPLPPQQEKRLASEQTANNVASGLGRVFGVLGGAEGFFAAKCCGAALLAYWFALSIGLQRPYWAIITSFIVAQPLAGIVLSKAVYRVIGTILGAAAAVLLVPAFVNSPELLVLALASWLGLCTMISLLDRSPRSYVFLLAGYTASIIGFPSVLVPSAIFDLASIRAQEICIGISAAALVHGLALPRSVAAAALSRVVQIGRDAETWTIHALHWRERSAFDGDRRKIATDLFELHQLSSHLPFDVAQLIPHRSAILAFQDQIALTLPLASAVRDRLSALDALPAGVPAEVEDLVAMTATWLSYPSGGDIVDHEAIAARCVALRRSAEDRRDWPALLLLNLVGRLEELVSAHKQCERLADYIRDASKKPPDGNEQGRYRGRRHPREHRDFLPALRGSIATALTVVGGCTFWIATAWPDGANAVLIAAVASALFANTDVPRLGARRLMTGAIIGVLLAFLYGFVILPRVTDFVILALALAPAFLVTGRLLADGKTSLVGLGVAITLPAVVGLNADYGSNFANVSNAAISQLLGIGFGTVVLELVRATGAESGVARIIRAIWRDLARLSEDARPIDMTAWIGRMLDRIALLVARIGGLGPKAIEHLTDALTHLRVGIAVGEICRFMGGVDAATRISLELCMLQIHRHFRVGRLDHLPPPDAVLIATLDEALATVGMRETGGLRRHLLVALVSLRRNLAPDAMPPELARLSSAIRREGV